MLLMRSGKMETNDTCMNPPAEKAKIQLVFLSTMEGLRSKSKAAKAPATPILAVPNWA